MKDLVIGGRMLKSRLFLGTGRFPNPHVMRQAIAASEAEVLTFAVRRVQLDAVDEDMILQHVDMERTIFLPNTSGARNAEEAVRIARLARASGIGNWIKVEICEENETLLPNPLETLKATEQLVAEGFVVLPYISDDPVICRLLEEAGAAAVMPGGSPIGSGLGILNPYNIARIVEQANVPIILDAGVGTAGDAVLAMELGVSAVLVNTAIAKARDPVAMARAFRLALEAGREAYLAGRIPRKKHASASSGFGSLVSRLPEQVN
jgi:thiazole synthase